ncbi:MAG: putative 2-aminoethylphosphonate ABC transporter ATP-binding protein [Rhodobacterales bacterium]|nr:MAG: putative 2-aminoethylphosphonate ABC transporter ATP-binding protein [Rhodobacterales bacterium]
MLDQTTSEQNPYLKIRDLWKKFDDFVALQDISLDVMDGEFLCFLGPSGCGKTTLLRAIAGLDLQTSGQISQAGRDVSNLPPSQRDFGIVFQSYALFPNLTIERNISYGLENQKWSKSDITARVAELLALVGLSDQGRKYPAQLSGGQQQRIALARAIAANPGLLLLDEPLSALDAKVRVHLRHEIKELQRKLGVTTVMVTHDQEEALAMADRIVVMNHGTIEQVGTPLEIYREPASLFVANFIGETNQIAAVAHGPGKVKIGNAVLECDHSPFTGNEPIIAAIRPEDVKPQIESSRQDSDLSAQITDMEFLGSFYRATLSCPDLGEVELVTDFSSNAVRRLGLSVGKSLPVHIPADRLKAFPAGDE